MKFSVKAFLILALCGSASVCKVMAAETKGWVFERVNGLGREVIYLNSDGLKIDYPIVGTHVISKPPSWNPVWVNTKAKTRYQQTLKSYRAEKGQAGDNSPPNLRISHVVYAGVKAKKIAVPEDESETGEIDWVARPEGTARTTILSHDYYITETIPVPPKACEFLDAYFGVPNYGGVPLACEAKLSDGKSRKMFYTTSIQQSPFSTSVFAIPSGLRPAATRSQAFGGSMKGALDGMAEDLGIGRGFGKDGK